MSMSRGLHANRGGSAVRAARRGRRGSTVVLVMIFLALFATLAIGFSAGTNMNLRQADNYVYVQSTNWRPRAA